MPPVLTRPDDPATPLAGRPAPLAPSLAASLAPRATLRSHGITGLPLGTEICTAEGILPVEWLTAGDRIVTRSGICRLLATETWLHHGTLIRIAPGAFGPAKPSRSLLLPPGQRIYLGAGESMPLSALRHGSGISSVEAADVRLIRLLFARPEIVTAGGVQLCCGTTAAAA